MPAQPNAQSAKIRVLIVDDSALIRKLLTEILRADPEIEVVGAAADPIMARNRIKELNPDVLTLDIEMPRMDGLTFLEKLMRLRPTPVVMISSLTETGADTTLQALEFGAIEYVTKPKFDIAYSLQNYAEEICGKVKIAARAKVRPLTAAILQTPKYSADAVLKKTQAPRFATTQKLIAIGASTGGTEAIKIVLEQMPADAPGIVITQHIPEIFSASFARRVNQYSAMTVKEAEHGEQILQGHAYVAPGNRHLLVLRDGARFRCALDDGPPVNRHRPSVDVLFRSVAQAAGFNAVGVILTGMGDDGARGLCELHSTGAVTFAQDEKTCVVWGMPAVAVQMGGVDKELPIQDIAEAVLKEIKLKKP